VLALRERPLLLQTVQLCYLSGVSAQQVAVAAAVGFNVRSMLPQLRAHKVFETGRRVLAAVMGAAVGGSGPNSASRTELARFLLTDEKAVKRAEVARARATASAALAPDVAVLLLILQNDEVTQCICTTHAQMEFYIRALRTALVATLAQSITACSAVATTTACIRKCTYTQVHECQQATHAD
jgi:hypothetical protein